MTKANKDGWIRHRGGKCPVEKGTLLDVRERSGKIWSGVLALESIDALEMYWRHDTPPPKSPVEIMAYRLHNPEEARPTEADPRVVEAKQAPKFDPVALRDEVRVMRIAIVAHQACISKNTALIAEIEKQLAEEGFALVEKQDQKQALPDMDDPANWMVGDVLLVKKTGDSIGGSSLGNGALVEFIGRRSMHARRITVKPMIGAIQHLEPCCFEFHSRP